MFCGRLNITFCYSYAYINQFYVHINQIIIQTNHLFALPNDLIVQLEDSNTLISIFYASAKKIIIDTNDFQIQISKSYASKCRKYQINELLKQQMEVYHGRAY